MNFTQAMETLLGYIKNERCPCFHPGDEPHVVFISAANARSFREQYGISVEDYDQAVTCLIQNRLAVKNRWKGLNLTEDGYIQICLEDWTPPKDLQ